jgi:hypothetical protein
LEGRRLRLDGQAGSVTAYCPAPDGAKVGRSPSPESNAWAGSSAAAGSPSGGEATLGRFGRRHALAAFGALLLAPQSGAAFGQTGAFNPRVLRVGDGKLDPVRSSGLARWSWELVRRTSAPGRLAPDAVAADDPELLAEPFVVWAGDRAVSALTAAEVRGLARFLRLGGMLVVDDARPETGAFGTSVRRELARVLPENPVVKLDASHVVYKTYYIIDRPVGRVLGPSHLDAIVRGRNAQVVLLSHDLLGALARTRAGDWAVEVSPGGYRQREFAVRLAVNLAMYLLCSDYKDDQVHAPWLMRRRAGRRP